LYKLLNDIRIANGDVRITYDNENDKRRRFLGTRFSEKVLPAVRRPGHGAHVEWAPFRRRFTKRRLHFPIVADISRGTLVPNVTSDVSRGVGWYA